MGGFQEFLELYQIIIVTISSIATIFFLKVLEDKITDKSIKIVVVVVLVSIGLVITNYAIGNLVENSPKVRKWIDKDNFIEGYYFDITLQDTTGHATILNIKYKDGEYLVFGDTFDSNWEHLSTFQSEQSVYSDRVLYFTFEAYPDDSPTIRGIDQLQFSLPPNSYSGFYINYMENPEFQNIKGARISDETVKKYNNFEEITDKSDFIKNEVEAFKREKIGTSGN